MFITLGFDENLCQNYGSQNWLKAFTARTHFCSAKIAHTNMTKLFKLESSREFASVRVEVYTCTSKPKVYNYIKNKINYQVQNFEAQIDRLAAGSFNKKLLLQTYKKVTKPAKYSNSALDVRRSAATEFLAEFFLEEKKGCIFYETINKKIKLPVDVDSHTHGIDVIGLQDKKSEDGICSKFVVAEVKSSTEGKIPSSQSYRLKKDVEKILDTDNKRLAREIFRVFELLNKDNKENQNKIYSHHLKLINEIILANFSQNKLIEKLIIYPFLISNNKKIIDEKNLDDFKTFSELDTRGIETTGILWVVDTNIDDFVTEVCSDDF